MSRTLIAAAGCVLFCLAGCEKEKVPEPMTPPSAATAPGPSAAAAPAPTAPTPTAAATAPTGTAENIPVAADFEDEAEKSITKANYKAELSSLEAEIK